MKKAGIVYSRKGSGLFSLFNNAISCLDVYDKLEVRWPPAMSPYRKIDVPNLWDIIASPIDICTPQDEPEHFYEWVHTYTGVNAAYAYLRDDGWRERLYGHLNRIAFQDTIQFTLNREVDISRLKDSVAIQHRSSKAIASEQLTENPIPIECMIRSANRISKTGSVFVACDHEKSLEAFRSVFGDRMISFSCLGYSNKGGEFHYENQCGVAHLQGMMAQTIALSCCKHLVHGVSNIATAALYMNPNNSHTFIQG